MTIINDEVEGSNKYIIETEKQLINGKTIVKLSPNNVYKVEAMLRADSAYSNTYDASKRRKMSRNNPSKMIYCGSTAYWGKQLKEILTKNNLEFSSEGYDYYDVIKYFVYAVDRENSTHLNSDNCGRENVIERICNLSKEELVQQLKYPQENNYELIKTIANSNQKDEKLHYSFATKFCHYACYFVFENTIDADNFSIYDSIIEKALPLYIKKYLNISVRTQEFRNNYGNYIRHIDEIRNASKKKYGEISRNGFDHLLWYYHKRK